MDTINVSSPNDGLGDKLRDAMVKVNSNFSELLATINNLDFSIAAITGLQTALNNIGTSITGSQSLQTTLNVGATAFGKNITLKQASNSDSLIQLNVDDFFESYIKVANGGAGSSGYFTKLGSNTIEFDGDGDFNTILQSGTGSSNTVRLPSNSGVLALTTDILVNETYYDSYLGTRLTPKNSAVNGFGISKSVNGSIGLSVKNTDGSGNGVISNISVGGTGSYYENGCSLIYYGAGYYIPSLRKTGGLYSNQDFNFLNINNSKIDFKTGTTITDVTSKFAISGGGTVSIGVTPSTDNTVTKGLARKSTGDLVEFIIPTAGATPSFQAVTNVGVTSSNTIAVGGVNISQNIVDEFGDPVSEGYNKIQCITGEAAKFNFLDNDDNTIFSFSNNIISIGNSDGFNTRIVGRSTTNGFFRFPLEETYNGCDTITCITNNTPPSAKASGVLGEIMVTSSYIYVCIATDTWRRATLSSW